MAEFYVGFWGPQAIDLLVDSYTYSTSGKVRLIARAEVGVTVRNIGAFAAYYRKSPAGVGADLHLVYAGITPDLHPIYT